MLTRLFNSNSIFTLVILVVSAILLWGKAFTNDIAMIDPVPVSPLYKQLFLSMKDMVVISSFGSILLILLEALLINYMLTESDLMPRKSYLAAFIYIMLTGLFNDFIILHPVMIAGLFIILAISLFTKLYERHDAYAMVFNIGTLISIASMFYFPAIVFILLILIGFIVYRLYAWREWLISIIGLALPYLFLGVYYFWNDCFQSKVELYKKALGFVNFYDFTPTFYAYLVFGVLSVLTLFSLLKLVAVINEKAIRIRKFLSFMIWFFVISCLSLNVSVEYQILGFVMMFISASILLTLYLLSIKKQLWSEILLIAMIFLVLSGRFGLWS